MEGRLRRMKKFRGQGILFIPELLFIDADHTYEAVLADIEVWGEMTLEKKDKVRQIMEEKNNEKT